MMQTQTLGEFLRAGREAAGLTQAQLGNQLLPRRSQPAVQLWESDRKTPGDATLRRLCARLGLDLAVGMRLLAQARRFHRIPFQDSVAEDSRLAELAAKEAA